VRSSFAGVALLYAVSSEGERVASVGGWDSEVERLFLCVIRQQPRLSGLKAGMRCSEVK
jgi:hypothetical protein